MSTVSPSRPRQARSTPAERAQQWRPSAPVLTLVVVAAVGTVWTLRSIDDPRTRTGLRVTVIDGDSFRSGGETFRLNDIDAPELRQTCKDATGAVWSCGTAARNRLAALSLRGDVACAPRGHDRYGRTLAVCSARGVNDLGETLVREGLALDTGRGGGTYFQAERDARDARRGLWSGDFERPQEWRRRHPRLD